jgi:hypothetical protein
VLEIKNAAMPWQALRRFYFRIAAVKKRFATKAFVISCLLIVTARGGQAFFGSAASKPLF